ncbi:MAG: CGNR zinc finger domain-containing protein [Steroidobacteraceae bacterium]
MNSDRFRIDRIRLDGGRPCLDFVNTIHDRFAAVPVDYLLYPRQYLAWCLRAQLLERHEAERITVRASVMADVRAYRQHLYALLSARIDGIAATARALRECDRWLHLAWANLSLDPGSPEAVSWPAAALDARLPLKRIALSALELLRTAAPGRLKRCASRDSCGWLFYDDSKGGQRRWCSMAACGTLDKMRRYRRAEPGD